VELIVLMVLGLGGAGVVGALVAFLYAISGPRSVPRIAPPEPAADADLDDLDPLAFRPNTPLRVDGVELLVSPWGHSKLKKRRLQITTQLVGAPEGLYCRRPLGTRTRFASGDGRFDSAVELHCADRQQLVACLDPEARQLIAEGVEAGCQVHLGKLMIDPAPRVADAEEARDWLRRMAALARAWRVPEDVEAALVARLGDPVPEMRRHAVRALAARVEPGAVPEAAALAQDEDAAVAWSAAQLAGMDDRPMARRVAVDGAQPDALRVDAAERAASGLTDAELRQMLEGPPAVQLAGARLAGRFSRVEVVDAVAKCARHDDARGLAAVEALGRLGGEAARAALAGLVRADRSTRQAAASARALGVCGTPQDIGVLSGPASNVLANALLRSEARAAMDAIQGRVPHGLRGALQVVGEGGALSLPREAGALSTASDARGVSPEREV
jgi:hypothetical protein